MQPVFRIRPHPRGSAQDAHPAAGSRLPCGLASRLLSGSAADRVRAAGVGPRWGTGFVSPPSRPSHSRLSPPGGAGSTWFSDLPSDGRDPRYLRLPRSGQCRLPRPTGSLARPWVYARERALVASSPFAPFSASGDPFLGFLNSTEKKNYKMEGTGTPI